MRSFVVVNNPKDWNFKKELIKEKYISFEVQKDFHENELSEIFLSTIKDAENTIIDSKKYLNVFGARNKCTANELWQHLFENIVFDSSIISDEELEPIKTILHNGTLATRIKKSLGNDLSHNNIVGVYKQLSNSLISNEMFAP